MNLNKFLRKNSRTLLMIFMSLLLVAFLIPDAIQGLASRGEAPKMKIGTAFGQEVTTHELRSARAELSVLRQMGLPVPPQIDELGYYLLTEQARRSGVRIGPDEVKNRLSRAGVTNETLAAVRRNTSLGYRQIYEVIGRWMAVLTLLDAESEAVFSSLPREELAYRDQSQEAIARLALIDARAFVHRVPEPTEEELQAFFAECGNRTQAHTEDELVFGYRLPPRVEVEYLTVDPELARRQVTIRASQVERYFEENRGRYLKPDPQGTREADGRVRQIPMDFDEAREQVREDCRLARAVEDAQRLVNELYDEVAAPWRAAPVGPDGFREPPGELVSFDELALSRSGRLTVEYNKTPALDAPGLGRLPGFGRAFYTEGRQRWTVPQLALRVQGILEKADPQGPALSIGEPAPVVMSENPRRRGEPYQAYLFRVVKAWPAAPPESLDAVRKQLVDDWKLAKAFELAGAEAEALAARAREIGLDAAVDEAAELKEILAAGERAALPPDAPAQPPPRLPEYLAELQPFQPEGLTRSAGFVRPRLGRTQNVPRAVFELAEAAAAAATNPATAPARRATHVPVASQFKWVVAEFVELRPLYRQAFEAELAGLSAQSQQAELQQFFQAWFSPERIYQRTGFRPAAAAAQPREAAP